MSYIENPKTKGSGIICCIPQTGECPVRCPDCFFQSGRSYLEPLEKNLPNMPELEDTVNRIVRVNDGNDSNNEPLLVREAIEDYANAFYNTSIPKNLEDFVDPVVLTVNPGNMTDRKAHLLDPIPNNLMFVRVRTNTWNIRVINDAIAYYTVKDVPVVLTFMAYYTETIPEEHKQFYTYRKRTLNSYWVITKEGWDRVCNKYRRNFYVHTCGKDADTHACKFCGNCLREYYATLERIRT